MDQTENYFLYHNKLLEEKIDHFIHNIEVRLDKLYSDGLSQRFTHPDSSSTTTSKPQANSFANNTYVQFKAPYIRDFRNFSGPSNNDVRQIRQLKGTENIEALIKDKSWPKETTQHLMDAILDHYSCIHLAKLLKQKNILKKQIEEEPDQNQVLEQKVNLIDEQIEQVKARKDQRIFVPSDRNDSGIDWCAISARLSNTHHEAQDCQLLWTNKLHWSINEGIWTKEEDVCLINAVHKYGKNDWDSVANALNNSRLPWQCCSRYHQELAESGSAPISSEDTEKLLEVINLCRIGDYVPWNQVMYFIQYHSLLQVKYQWHKHISERPSNRPFTQHEDLLLIGLVEKFGEKDWNRVANYIPGRSNKSCRERFTMRLKFRRRAIGCWRRKEDATLISLVDRFGTNWTLIATHFPERNNHQLRSRYELLKNDVSRIGTLKHRKLYRNADGLLVSSYSRRKKPATDREVDDRLHEIFSTFQNVQSKPKTLVCRSVQDELIHQTLIYVLRHTLTGRKLDHNLLSSIIDKALKENVSSKYELFPPCISTIRGYKAWTAQQDYLTQFSNHPVDMDVITSTSEYHNLKRMIMSLFIWPAVLSRVQAPQIDINSLNFSSIAEKSNLYKVRSIQQQITTKSIDPKQHIEM